MKNKIIKFKSQLFFFLLLIANVVIAQQNKNTSTDGSFTNGTIVSSDNATIRSQMRASDKSYDETIVGVYYNTPQPEGSQAMIKQNPFVTTGITSVKYNSENGKINKGDFITTSSEAGVGMKATKTGMVLGVALENASASSGLIKIRVLIQYAHLSAEDKK